MPWDRQIRRPAALVTWRKLNNGIGVIRIENSLGDKATVAQFDHAIEALKDVKA